MSGPILWRKINLEYDKRQLEKHEREFRRKESDREYAKLLEAARQKPITDYVNTGDYLAREYIGKVIKTYE